MVRSSIFERTNVYSEDSFFSAAMKPIYEDVSKIKGKTGAPMKRANHFERLVTKRDGVWLEVHDSIENEFEQVFKRAEERLLKAFGRIFDSLHQNFLFLCDSTDTKGEKERAQEQLLRTKLKENLVEVKALVEECGQIPELVAKCKAHTS